MEVDPGRILKPYTPTHAKRGTPPKRALLEGTYEYATLNPKPQAIWKFRNLSSKLLQHAWQEEVEIDFCSDLSDKTWFRRLPPARAFVAQLGSKIFCELLRSANDGLLPHAASVVFSPGKDKPQKPLRAARSLVPHVFHW